MREEILLTVGTQHAYYLLAEALFDESTRLGLEEPGHPHARNSFALRRPQTVEAAVDGEGVVVDTLPPLDYLFVTPSHQSPTTATLSLERRHALLRRAEEDDFVLIEDDYEAENLYVGTPMPAQMQSVCAEIRVPRYRRAFTLSRELDSARIEASMKGVNCGFRK